MEEIVTQLCVLQWIGRKESGANRIAQVRQSLYCHVYDFHLFLTYLWMGHIALIFC